MQEKKLRKPAETTVNANIRKLNVSQC